MKQKLWELHSHKHWHRKFPRNTKRIKNFEGPLLTNRKVWGWREYYGGWLRRGQVSGLISQYIGKSYDKLQEAWHRKVKHLKARHPYEVSLKNWIGRDRYGNYREYYVNDEDIICVNAKYHRKDHHYTYNSKVKLPDFGAVRKIPIYNGDYYVPYSFKGKLAEPIYVGKLYCRIDNNDYLLPVYQCSNQIYHKFQEWWKGRNVPHYEAHKWKWTTDPYIPFKDWLGKGWSKKHQFADEIEKTWMAPLMPGAPTEQHCYQQIPNPKLPSYRRELFQEMNEEFPIESRIEWLKDQLANHQTIQADFGMGKLCLLVKREDYENYKKQQERT